MGTQTPMGKLTGWCYRVPEGNEPGFAGVGKTGKLEPT